MYDIRRTLNAGPFQPVIGACRQRANEEAQRAPYEEAPTSILATSAPTPQVSQPAPRPYVDHHRPTDPSRPPALESVQAKTINKVASAYLLSMSTFSLQRLVHPVTRALRLRSPRKPIEGYHRTARTIRHHAHANWTMTSSSTVPTGRRMSKPCLMSVLRLCASYHAAARSLAPKIETRVSSGPDEPVTPARRRIGPRDRSR